MIRRPSGAMQARNDVPLLALIESKGGLRRSSGKTFGGLGQDEGQFLCTSQLQGLSTLR